MTPSEGNFSNCKTDANKAILKQMFKLLLSNTLNNIKLSFNPNRVQLKLAKTLHNVSKILLNLDHYYTTIHKSNLMTNFGKTDFNT